MRYKVGDKVLLVSYDTAIRLHADNTLGKRMYEQAYIIFKKEHDRYIRVKRESDGYTFLILEDEIARGASCLQL